MSWAFERPLPFTMTDAIYFSPIVDDVVYVIDRGTEFWKYNLNTKIWSELSSPNLVGTNAYRQLAINPTGDKLACLSYISPSIQTISIYTISSDSWNDSSTAPDIEGETARLRALVFNTDDEIWVWARKGNTNNGKCIKYVPSTDTWTQYANTTGILDSWYGHCAAIKSDGSAVFGGRIGAYTGAPDAPYCKYTVATDVYTFVARRYYWYAHVYDRDKLWYYRRRTGADDYRPGYLDTSDQSYNNNQFVANPDRQIAITSFGVSDDLNTIIARARLTAPELMSLGAPPAPAKKFRVKGTYLHYTDFLWDERRFEGALTGNARTAGSIKTKGTKFVYGDNNGDERDIEGTLTSNTVTAGKIGVKGTQFRYGGNDTDERYIEGSLV